MIHKGLEVIPAAPDEAPVLANLLNLYMHDFSEVMDLEIGDDGRFLYPQLDRYWTDPDHYPFSIKLDGKYAGVALVKQEPSVWDMAEFFILRGYRRRSIGTRAAHEIWKRFPGPWEIRVMQSNIPGLNFWPKAISSLSGELTESVRVELRGIWWTVFSFESRP